MTGIVLAVVSVLIAAGALVVAIISYCGQAATARKQTALAQEQTTIQARLADIEEDRRAEELDARQRAQVVAEFAGPPGRRLLVLANEGPAPARDVRCTLRARGGGSLPSIFGLEDQPFTLQPGRPMEFRTATDLQTARVMQATVTWTDGAGQHETAYDLRL